MRAEARRQLKQDRFSRATIHAAEQTVHWTVEHKNKMTVAGIVLAVLIAAAVGGWYYNERRDEKASADFGKVFIFEHGFRRRIARVSGVMCRSI